MQNQLPFSINNLPNVFSDFRKAIELNNITPSNHYGYADFPSGQLRSNIIDMSNFLIMYLNQGTFNGNMVLSSETINMMHSIQFGNDQGLIWYIENPRGKMRKAPQWSLLNHVRHTVSYCKYGDVRMKPTDIWTNDFNWTPRVMCKPFKYNKNVAYLLPPLFTKS